MEGVWMAPVMMTLRLTLEPPWAAWRGKIETTKLTKNTKEKPTSR
jgi:hypothetical protein